MTKEEGNIEYQAYLDWLREKDKTVDEEFDLYLETPLTKRIPCIVDTVFPNSVLVNPHNDKTDGTTDMRRKGFFIPLQEFSGYTPSEGDLIFCCMEKDGSRHHLAVETGLFEFFEESWGIRIPEKICSLYEPHVEASSLWGMKISTQSYQHMLKFVCTRFVSVPQNVADGLRLNDKTWRSKMRFFWLGEKSKPFWEVTTICMISPWLIKCSTVGGMYRFAEYFLKKSVNCSMC